MTKTVEESHTQQVQLLMQRHMNGLERLYGGQLLEWIDTVAGVVSRRHCESQTVTVFIDDLEFRSPAYLNDMLVLDGRVTWVGKSSMEVRVDTFIEKSASERTLINRAYFVMVAIDENGKSIEVPRLELTTDEEKREWEAGEKRQIHRVKHRNRQQNSN